MREPRIFTLAEAERTLPLVRRIAHDVMLEYAAWRRAVGRYELEAAGLKGDDEEPAAVASLRAEVERSAERLEGFLAEIGQVGCVFKGFEEGLVDFCTLRDDRLVFLCWRYGEPRITHWHEVDAGFSGRQPLDTDRLSPVS
jgi:hypothetical protein